jgi:hypothetical protein
MDEESLHRSHDRLQAATERMLRYLKDENYDSAVQEALWKEMEEARPELSAVVDQRKSRGASGQN